MKKIIFSLIMFFFILGNISSQTIYPNYADGYLNFKFKDSYPIDFHVDQDNTISITEFPFLLELVNEFGITNITRPLGSFNTPRTNRIIDVQFDSIKKVDLFIQKLSDYDFVEYVEKVVIMETFDYPNDPLNTAYSSEYNFRWHLDAIKADSAWMLRKPSSNVKVAVIDIAVWGEHPDLQIPLDRQYSGDPESFGSSSPPDSAIFIQSIRCPNPSNCYSKEWSHGTHCAGLAGAITNNAEGISSIGGGVTLMGVNATRLSDKRLMYAPNCIGWATSQGAKVMSLSFGWMTDTKAMKDAVDAAYDAGVIVVAASGNMGNEENPKTYPAGNPNVLSVASTDSDNKLSFFSEFGNWINIAAPGGYDVSKGETSNTRRGILSTMVSCTQELNYNLGYYDAMVGTSMACPIVAGLCGLLLTRDPDLTFERIKYYLQTYSQELKVNPIYPDRNIQSGVIDAYATLKAVGDSMPTVKIQSGIATGFAPLEIHFADESELGRNGTFKSRKWYFPDATETESDEETPTATYLEPGIYDVGLVVTNNHTRKNYKNTDYYLKDSLVLKNHINVRLANGIDTLYVNKDTVSISAFAKNISDFQVLSSSMNWKIEGENSWLSYTVDSLDKTGNGIVKLTTTNLNPVSEARYAIYFVINNLTHDTAKVVVKQEPATPIFKISKSLLTPAAGRTNLSFEIRSSVNWELISEVPNWIKLSQTTGGAGNFIEWVTAEANESYEGRSVVIQFKGGDVLKSVTVLQAGMPVPVGVDPKEFVFKGARGDKAEMSITTDSSWVISNIPNWLSVIPDSGYSNTTVSLETREDNKTGNERGNYIQITAKGSTPGIEYAYVLQEGYTGIAIPGINKLAVYPNPVKDKLIVENGLSFVKEYHILDMGGRVLAYQAQKTNYMELDFSNFAKGTYVVKITANDGTQYIRKIVKQ